MAKKQTEDLILDQGLDPLFKEMIQPFYAGSVTVLELQKKTEKYIDSRIEKFLNRQKDGQT